MQRIVDPASWPTNLHCTAGKDRAGWGSALTLLALGVPAETVMEDYLLSDEYRAEENAATIEQVRAAVAAVQGVEASAITNTDLEPIIALLEVRPEYLQAALDTVETEFGGLDAYLADGLGLTAEQLEDLPLRDARMNPTGGHVELGPGQTAVVVGGGSGIGRGTSLGLAAEGVNVVVGDIDLDSAESVRDEISSRGGKATAHRVDGTSRDSLTDLADAAAVDFGAIHVLCNNVGVVTDLSLDAATETDWAWVIEFNLMSIVRSVDIFLPRLRAHGQPAHIVNTASMAALQAVTPSMAGGTHLGLYTATKHAILGYCEILRDELREESIGVSVLCPGMVESNLGSTSGRHRPERYGGPFDRFRGADVPVIPGQMPNEEVGPFVVKGIRGNRLHILTHTDTRLLRARHQVLMDDAAYYDT